MHRFSKRLIVAVAFCSLLLSVIALPAFAAPGASVHAAAPTVTATIGGMSVTVRTDEPQYNVRSGPSTSAYPVIGILLPGQTVLAKGRSPGGEWIQINFPGVPENVGWVATINLKIPINVSIPISEPPPTPAPQYTATIDPTLAAQFIVTQAPTRLATFTPPAPLIVPTLPAAAAASSPGGIPMGMVIVILAALGVFLGLVSLIRGR
jgi:uncharacterized protein YraI